MIIWNMMKAIPKASLNYAVKVKDTCLEVERDSEVMYRIKNELELATGRFYVPILNPVSGSPSGGNPRHKVEIFHFAWRRIAPEVLDRIPFTTSH